MTNCTFTGCSYQLWGDTDVGAWNNTWTFENNTFSSSVIVTANVGGIANAAVLITALASTMEGTGTIQGCIVDSVFATLSNTPTFAVTVNECQFLGRANWHQPLAFTITNNFFNDSMIGGTNSSPWTTFDGNFVTRITDDSQENDLLGSVTNNYFYTTQTVALTAWLVTSQAPTTVAYNVCEYAGPTLVFCFEETEELTVEAITCQFSYNLFFSSSTGSWAPAIFADSNPSQPYQDVTSIFHNTIVTKGGSAIAGAGASGFKADSVALVGGNILVNTGSATGTYAFQNTCTTLAVDQAPASAFKANAWNGFSTVSGDPFSAVTGDTNIENATPYYSPMSGSTAPGTGDLKNTNPQFLDTTRTLATWGGTTAGGGTATVAGAMAAIKANPSLVKQATTGLLAWVRHGYCPTNSALKAASYSGDTSTADANGTAWPGSGPGIGAMAYTSGGSSTPTSYPASMLLGL